MLFYMVLKKSQNAIVELVQNRYIILLDVDIQKRKKPTESGKATKKYKEFKFQWHMVFGNSLKQLMVNTLVGKASNKN